MPGSQPFLARLQTQAGVALHDLNVLGEAETHFRGSIDRFRRLLARSPERLSFQLGLAKASEGLAGVLLALGKRAEAEEASRTAVELRQKFSDSFPESPSEWHGRASSQAFHACLLMSLGRRPEAENEFRNAIPFQRKVVEATRNSRRAQELNVMEACLAWLQLRTPRSAKETRAELSRLARAHPIAPPAERFRIVLKSLAHYRLGEWKAALACLQQAGALPGDKSCSWTTDDHLIRRIGESQATIAGSVGEFCLAMTYYRLGRPEAALQSYRKALGGCRHDQPRSPFQVVDAEALQSEAAHLLGVDESTLR
jgi:tetratricopeptide (TPR) repeat protein